MAGTTGPISTLPGVHHTLPEGQMCDIHQNRKAVARIQGETDSFGSEMNDLCQECVDEFKKHAQEAKVGMCDWCKKEATDLRNRRDFEEGRAGRVYQICGACVKLKNERLEAALDYYEGE